MFSRLCLIILIYFCNYSPHLFLRRFADTQPWQKPERVALSFFCSSVRSVGFVLWALEDPLSCRSGYRLRVSHNLASVTWAAYLVCQGQNQRCVCQIVTNSLNGFLNRKKYQVKI